MQEKILQDPGPNTHTVATTRKEVLTPQPPTPPKRGTRVRGGGGGTGVKIQKFMGGLFSVLNDDFIRG